MKQCKLFLSLLLTVLCLLACAAADEPVEYTCSDYVYILLEDGTAEITDYTGAATTLTVPEMLDGYRVTSIGDRAFYFCRSLMSITLPNGVTSIGDSAFHSCFNLKSVTLPEGLTSIGDEAFFSCGFLTSITLPDSVTSIGEYAFTGCSKQLTFTVPMDSWAEQWCIDNNMKYTFTNANDRLLN